MVKAAIQSDNKKTLLKINDKWVNVEIWKRTHPGGAEPLERYSGQDATDPFIALHSEEALKMVENMKEIKPSSNVLQECVETSKFELNFRKWRETLASEGYFERDWKIDFFHIALMFVWCIIGVSLAWRVPLLAMVFLGLGMQQAGWIGHDYNHGRGKLSYFLGRFIGGFVNGFSAQWWSDKHNTHHVHPNQAGVDEDIHNDPILHLHIPQSDDEDVWFRQYQHYYYHIAYAFLYVSWRIQSAQSAYKRGDKIELALIVLNYAMLAMLPLQVVVGSILIGGFLVAEIVTATHQSEDMFDGLDHAFVKNQFLTTRDVHMDSTIGNYIWGGMQFQLIHHLFPTMPRYYYQSMVPKVTQFAKNNAIEYRTASCVEIFKMNFETMKKYAAKQAQ